MKYREWLVDDLRELELLRYSASSLRRELETVDAEIAAVQAGPQDAEREEWLLDARARWMDMDRNLRATEMHVADMDRLLGELPADERCALTAFYLRGGHEALLDAMFELHVEKTTLYKLRDRALRRLALLRFGAGARGI